MAIYHCSVKTISRSAGRSATAAAAYRSGSKIEDQRTAEIHDYTRKGGVMVTGIVAPEDAPAWAKDRAALWNQAETSEKRKNSTVAREVEVALPSELNAGQMRKLTEDYGKWLVGRYGVAVDWAVHQPHRHGDDRNHHAHMLMTTRALGPDGLGDKTRVLDDKLTGPDEVKTIREHWALHVNKALEQAGIEARVDHRSLAAQGIDREPTAHLGPAAVGYERRTKQPSNKRIQIEREVAERLARAKAEGELERQRLQSASLIVTAGVTDFMTRFEAAKQREERAVEQRRLEAAKQREKQAPKRRLDREGPSL